MFIEKKSCEKCIVYGEGNIKKVITAIEKGGLRIAIILDKGNQLQGTISDGDIRRGLLKGLTLNASYFQVIRRNCFTATLKRSKTDILKMMRDNAISQIPIISRG